MPGAPSNVLASSSDARSSYPPKIASPESRTLPQFADGSSEALEVCACGLSSHGRRAKDVVPRSYTRNEDKGDVKGQGKGFKGSFNEGPFNKGLF